jgi:3-hydroxyisobutyrate dehydrogenase-like beta-hydroxyacid dehydrogenase
MAEAAGVPLLLGGAVDDLNKLAVLHGLGEEDTAAMWKMLTALWNTQAEKV